MPTRSGSPRAMIRNARMVTVLADPGKFGRHAAYAVCATEDIDLIISDASRIPSETWSDTLSGCPMLTDSLVKK